MTTFNDREQAFERKFAHDEELRFKTMARRNKMLGLWAAEKLGKTGPDADAYARTVVLADFEEAGEEDVLRKISADLTGMGTGEAEIRAAMDRLLGQAKADIAAGR